MSGTEFLSGRMAANFVHQGAVNEWENYSNRLKSKLQQTEMDFVKAESGRIGFAQLFKSMTDELRRVDPNNPLLVKENQLRVVSTRMTEKAAEMGYVYDARSDRITGRR